MICRAKDPGRVKLNSTLLASLAECFNIAEFSVSFKAGCLNMKDFRYWFKPGTVSVTRAISAVQTGKSQRRTSERFMTGFHGNEKIY